MENPFKKITLPRRILLHLVWYNVGAGDYVLPMSLTQQGISEAMNVRRSQVSSALKGLGEECLVQDSLSHVAGCSRRLKTYVLTPQGRETASNIKKDILDALIESSEGETTTVGKVVAENSISYTDIIRQMDEYGNVDPSRSLMKEEPGKQDCVFYMENVPCCKVFVGRENEKQEILDWLNNTPSGVYAVHGLAGIGKTVLVREVMEHIRSTHSVFWFRSESWATRRMFLRELALFLSSRGLPRLQTQMESGHVDFDMALGALGEAAKDGAQVLVVDDCYLLSNPDICSMLSRAAATNGTHLILISRDKLDNYGPRDVKIEGTVKELFLTELSQDDGLRLLQLRGVSVDKDAQELYTRTGGHPLAMELASHDPEHSLKDVVTFFKDEILVKISDIQRGMLAIASIFRRPVPIEALFIDGGNYEDLDKLLDMALLYEVDGGYSLHRILSEVMTSRLTSEEKRSFHTFVAKFYDSKKEGTGEVSAEDALEAVHHYAFARDPAEAAKIVLETGRSFLSHGFQYEALEAISALDKEGITSEQLLGLSSLSGMLLVFIGRVQAAEKMLESVLTRMPEDSLERARTLNALGIAAYKQGDLDKAMGKYTEALVNAERGDNKDQMAWAIGHMAVIHGDRGNLDLALMAHQMDRGISETISDKKGMARANNNIGLICHKQKRYGDALEMFQTCFDMAVGIGNMHTATIALNNLGDTQRCMGNADKAKEYFREGYKQARNYRFPWEEAEALFYLGQLESDKDMLSLSSSMYAHLGNLEKAKEAEEHLQKL